jgi:poly-gamma-glutamate capsule biosynthesis protein CapA/YwtB (metallophosphatase superfamily)
MQRRPLTLMAVGDIILGPKPQYYFSPSKAVLKSADLLMGQLEVPYTARDANALALGRNPQVLKSLANSGFHLVTLAGNHLADAGRAGIEDTLEWLDRNHIAHVGAGLNLEEARRHVVLERGKTRFGFLDYNCVGPKETWATATKAGGAYLNIITHYELDYATPGGPPVIYTWAETSSVNAMLEDISKVRPLCDVLIVSFHKGLGHTPVKLAAYEQQISYAAIDAGADVILGHHGHILKGVELYKEKPIFHSLCNFVAWVPSLAAKPGQDPHSWEVRRKELFGFEPDPEYPTYPFHPEAIYTLIAKCDVESGKLSRIGYLPCIVNKQGQPEIVKNDSRGERVFDYMSKITKGAGLKTSYKWHGDEIICSSG